MVENCIEEEFPDGPVGGGGMLDCDEGGLCCEAGGKLDGIDCCDENPPTCGDGIGSLIILCCCEGVEDDIIRLPSERLPIIEPAVLEPIGLPPIRVFWLAC